MIVQKAIEVNVPANRVWPYFVEPEKIMQWCITFKKFEYTSDQHSGVGTPLYIEEQAGGPLMKMRFEITEWKDNEIVTLRMVSGPMMKSYEQFWKLEPTPSGSCISFREDIEFSLGVVGKLLDFIEARASVGTIDKMLVKLKSLVEA
jgi:Polyketide cyclase / dehydrase and lipid transport